MVLSISQMMNVGHRLEDGSPCSDSDTVTGLAKLACALFASPLVRAGAIPLAAPCIAASAAAAAVVTGAVAAVVAVVAAVSAAVAAVSAAAAAGAGAAWGVLSNAAAVAGAGWALLPLLSQT